MHVHVQSVTKVGNQARHFAEILQVQEYIQSRHALSADTTHKIQAMRTFTFDYLKLDTTAFPVNGLHSAALAALALAPRSEKALMPDAALPT